MVGTMPLQSLQVALPQTHGPRTVPDGSLMSGEDQIFDFQLAVLKEKNKIEYLNFSAKLKNKNTQWWQKDVLYTLYLFMQMKISSDQQEKFINLLGFFKTYTVVKWKFKWKKIKLKPLDPIESWFNYLKCKRLST